MKIVITGASGLIGSVLVESSWKQCHSLGLLNRSCPRQIGLGKNSGSYGDRQRAVDGADGIINLALEPIAGKRWTKAQKKRLRDSRIDSSRSLVNFGVRVALLIDRR